MASRTISFIASALLVGAVVSAPQSAQAADVRECISIPGKVGSGLDANVGKYPIEKPDGYRTIAGKQEPFYRVSIGETLHVRTRLTNSGTCSYWAYRGDFVTIGDDVFDIPGKSKPVEGKGNYAWSFAVGVPSWDENPNRDHPYTRRTEILYEQLYPGDYSKRLWPITVDKLPKRGVYYSVEIAYEGTVSDPPLHDLPRSKRFWVIAQ